MTARSERQLSDYDTIICFDTETTGLDAKQCQIIEIAMLILKKNGPAYEYDRFIRLPSGEHVPADIAALTGITDEMLVDGITELEAAHAFQSAISIGKNTLMIAHNCQFDLCFVWELLRRIYGRKEGDQLISSVDWLDSLTVYKDRAAYPNRLENAIEHYCLTDKAANTHRAIDDAKALVAVCDAMDRERDDLGQYINVFGFNPRYGVTGERLGKITYLPQPYVQGTGMIASNYILPKRKTSAT